ncbi:UNVERIFIED_CONTAM: Tyrosine-specific transport protein 2 [Sesamum calycinum]|uniref:Tyrosine-specific transport protein 2 n=1 Tax=Sesamum calycinum TaxID=2727403 RepID=A0AAW2JLC3_9LAMI
MMMGMLPSFSSSFLACTPKFSLYGNPQLFRRIKNLKTFPTCANFDPSRTQQLLLTHSFVDSPLRASVKCFSKGPPSLDKISRSWCKKWKMRDKFEFERLFSNLNQATLKREPGSLSSSKLVFATVRILAIPAVTQEAGFLASAIICILCWIFMVVSGLLIAEVNVNTMCELVLVVFHWYQWPREPLETSESRLPGVDGQRYDCRWETATLFSLLFGGLCYFGSQQIIGAVNGALVVGIIASFTALVVVASGDLHWDALLQANLEAAPRSIPIIALSFVIRTAIVLGTAIPLALFLVWNAVILGTITTPELGSNTLVDPLQQLRSTNGVVGPIVDLFSVLAIATSYIGFVLGLSDFLADLLKLPSGQNKPLPYLLTLVPPLILALLDPEIFYKALDFAGTYGDRYSESSKSPKIPLLVPGGKLTLSLVMGGAGLVILTEILENFGHA